MNGSICMFWLFLNPFGIERKHKLRRCCSCSFSLFKRGREATSRQQLFPCKLRWFWHFDGSEHFNGKGVCVCVLLHRLGAVFIFFDNKLGNYSVMIKIYSTTRGMCACIYIGCVCTRAVYVWNGHWRNCILHGKKWEGSNEVPRTLVLLLVLVVVIYYMYRYQSANEGKISRC